MLTGLIFFWKNRCTASNKAYAQSIDVRDIYLYIYPRNKLSYPLFS